MKENSRIFQTNLYFLDILVYILPRILLLNKFWRYDVRFHFLPEIRRSWDIEKASYYFFLKLLRDIFDHDARSCSVHAFWSVNFIWVKKIYSDDCSVERYGFTYSSTIISFLGFIESYHYFFKTVYNLQLCGQLRSDVAVGLRQLKMDEHRK